MIFLNFIFQFTIFHAAGVYSFYASLNFKGWIFHVEEIELIHFHILIN